MDALERSGGEFINARLSVLLPGTHITPHCGVSNAKLRVHIGLRVPRDPHTAGVSDSDDGGVGTGRHSHASALGWSGMIVAGERIEWSEGGAVVFDDSFEHEVRWRPNHGGHYSSQAGSSGTREGLCDGDDDAGRAGSSKTAAAITDERVVLIIDIWHPELSEVERVRARRQFAPEVPGGFRVGDRVRCAVSGYQDALVTLGAAGVVLGRGTNDPTRVAVDLSVDLPAEQHRVVEVAPLDFVPESEWEMRLSGGFQRGDVVAITDPTTGNRTDDLAALVGSGDVLTVIGPGESPTALVLLTEHGERIEVERK